MWVQGVGVPFKTLNPNPKHDQDALRGCPAPRTAAWTTHEQGAVGKV